MVNEERGEVETRGTLGVKCNGTRIQQCSRATGLKEADLEIVMCSVCEVEEVG